ncbi:MAG: DUF3859 domain-containing protein [Proteobacteria bacterium]|nr:DUF3859 domain-containing protein [Pseudomonadota bacterium]
MTLHAAFARLTVVAALALLAPSAHAAGPISVEIVDIGIYVVNSGESTLQPDGIVDSRVTEICHLATTVTIPAKLNISFGFRYRVKGSPGTVRPLTVVKHFPVEVSPPGAPKPFSSFSRTIAAAPGVIRYAGYTMDHDWEILPGTWVFQIFDGGRKLAEKRFTIVEGAPIPAPANNSQNCFKMSGTLPYTPVKKSA